MSRLGLNTPEILLYLPLADTTNDLIKNEALKQHYVGIVNKFKTKVIIRQESSDAMGTVYPYGLVEKGFKLSDVNKELILLKYPKGTEEFWGHITIQPLYFKIKLWASRDRLMEGKRYWNDIPASVEEGVVEQEIKRVRFDLDGYRIHFSYFSKPCGMLSKQLVFWGL